MNSIIIIQEGRNLNCHYSWCCGDRCCSGTESDYELLEVGDVLKFRGEGDWLFIEGWFATDGQTGDGEQPMWVYPWQVTDLIKEGYAKYVL